MASLQRLLFVTLAGFAPLGALAHTGHAGTDTWFAGLAHPLGPDHLLAMLAVGLWAALAWPRGRRLAAPVVFMLVLTLAAAAAASGLWHSSWLEYAIAASVAVFGALLFAPRALPRPLALGVIAFGAALHGLAHGAELPPGAAFSSYAAGFLLSTAALHAAGLALGSRLEGAHAHVGRALAATLAAAGVALLALAA